MMDLSPANMGLAVGLVVGLADYFIITVLNNLLAKKAVAQNTPPEEARKVAQALRAVALASLILLPIMGYFVGPYVFAAVPVNVGG